jgi:hypothetical protein
VYRKESRHVLMDRQQMGQTARAHGHLQRMAIVDTLWLFDFASPFSRLAVCAPLPASASFNLLCADSRRGTG